jgi:hypothetical protein
LSGTFPLVKSSSLYDVKNQMLQKTIEKCKSVIIYPSITVELYDDNKNVIVRIHNNGDKSKHYNLTGLLHNKKIGYYTAKYNGATTVLTHALFPDSSLSVGQKLTSLNNKYTLQITETGMFIKNLHENKDVWSKQYKDTYMFDFRNNGSIFLLNKSRDRLGWTTKSGRGDLIILTNEGKIRMMSGTGTYWEDGPLTVSEKVKISFGNF